MSTQPLKLIFMGTGQFACPVLRALLDTQEHSVLAVVSQPDRPAGRHLQLRQSPVKQFCESRGLEVLTPENPNDAAFISQLAGLSPDLIVVCDYGEFLKADLLAVPRLGAINVHPSLLPRYRGAAPIQWAIANGEVETGVSVLYVTEKMDAGDILAQERVPIRYEDTTQTLEPLLAELGGFLLLRVLRKLAEGTAKAIPQDESQATYARKLKKEDGRIDWNMPAEAIRNRIRAFQPWPGTYCEVPFNGRHVLKILSAQVEQRSGEPGTVLECSTRGPLVACGEGSLRLLLVQPEARKVMTGEAYVCGYRLKPGLKLE